MSFDQERASVVKLATTDEFDELIAAAGRQAMKSGMKRSDISKAIAAHIPAGIFWDRSSQNGFWLQAVAKF